MVTLILQDTVGRRLGLVEEVFRALEAYSRGELEDLNPFSSCLNLLELFYGCD